MKPNFIPAAICFVCALANIPGMVAGFAISFAAFFFCCLAGITILGRS